MASANLASESAVLKTLYPTLVTEQWFERMKLLALCKKETNFFGANFVQATRYAVTAGRSRSFGNALANMAPTKTARFTVTRAHDYSLFSIDGETIDAASNDKGAIVDEITLQVDAAMDAIELSTGRSIYRNTGGALGQVSTATTYTDSTGGSHNVGIAQPAILLVDPNTAIFFEPGCFYGTSTTSGTTGSIKTGVVQLGAVDYQLGVLTTANGLNWSDPSNAPNIATSDFVFADGDFGQSIAGLDGWFPGTAPLPGGGDSWFGLDRSISPSKLAGVRCVNTAGLDPAEALQRGLQQVYRMGGMPKTIMENDADYLALVLSLGTRVQYTTVETDAKIGFEGVKVTGPYGPVTVLPDPNCQQGLAWALSMDHLIWRTLKEYPRFLDADKLGRFIREPSSDSYQGRIGGYGNPMTDAPGWFARIPL